MAHDVFISYAASDKAVADAVCSQLESMHRIRCWIAPRDVLPGASWAESIIDALDESKIMVLIFSSSANASTQIEREVERAVHKGVNIIPLRIEDTVPTKTLEYFISAPHWLDALTVPLEQHINRLAASVKALLAKPVVPHDAGTAATRSVKHAGAVQPAAMTEQKVGSQRPGWLIPALVGGVVAVLAVAFGIGAWSKSAPAAITTAQSEPSAPSQPSTDPVSAVPAPPPEQTAASAVAPPAPTPVAVAPAPPASSTIEPGVTAGRDSLPAPSPPRAKAAPTTVRTANVFVDFRNNLSDGSIVLELDGQKMWTEKLGGGLKGRSTETLRAALNVPKGPHNVTVTLLNREEKVRDTNSLNLGLIDPAVPRTVLIRLSRFKKDLELQLIDGKPPEDAKAAAEKPPNDAKAVAGKPGNNAKAVVGKPADDAKAVAGKPANDARAGSREPAK